MRIIRITAALALSALAGCTVNQSIDVAPHYAAQGAEAKPPSNNLPTVEYEPVEEARVTLPTSEPSNGWTRIPVPSEPSEVPQAR